MALPASFNTVEVRGKYVDLKGNPVAGSLAFSASVAAFTAPIELTTIIGREITVQLDAAGEFSLLLPATDDPDITPTSFTYTVRESFNGLVGRTFDIAVPLAMADDGVDISTVVPALPSKGVLRPAFGNVLTIASQAILPAPIGADVFLVTGTTQIDEIAPTYAGRTITLRFSDNLTIATEDGGIPVTATDALVLHFDGVEWLVLTSTAAEVPTAA